MICSCVCTKSSSFPAENSKHRGTSKSCKACGGRLLGGGLEAEQGSMLSNGGLELSSVINPHLTWKTASNGRQRAVRRARTSFRGVNRKSSPAESLNVSKDLIDNNSRSTGDMPVSESEKVGVSILGRRFSDDFGSVPIKKRRFLLVHSPSSLHRSSSYSDGSGCVLERQTTSYQGTLLNEKRNSFHMNSGSKSELGQERNLGFERTDLQGANEKICIAADFSGISILAAAACDSNIECDFTNVEGSLPKADAAEVGVAKESRRLDLHPLKEEEPLLHTSEDLTDRTDLPFEASSSSFLHSKELNEVKSDGSVSSFHNIQNNTEDSSSHDVRFPWDLNAAIDVWESHEEVLNSDPEATNVSEDADRNEQDGNPGPSIDHMRSEDIENIPVDEETGDSRDRLGGGERKDSMGSNPCVDTLVEGKHLKNAKIDMVDCEETKSSVNKEMIRIVSSNFPSPVKGVLDSLADASDFSLSSDAVIEERKEEATRIPFRSKPEAEKSSPYSVSNENASVDPPTIGSGTHHGNHNGPFEAGTDVRMTGFTDTRIPQAEKHEFLCFDSLACPLAEKGSEFLAGGDACENITGAVTSGSNVHTSVLDETGHSNAKCKEKDASDCGTIAVGVKMDTPKMHAPFNDMDAAKSYFPPNVGSDVSVCKSSDVTSGNADGRSLLIANIVNDVASNSVQVAIEHHLECHNSRDASQNDAADQPTGMEKIDLLGDDDSQYEDGEFRESLACCWLDDGVEEAETEHVDYGSDRDTDIYEGASNLSSVSQHVDNVEQLNAEFGKGTQNASQSFHNYALLPDVGYAKRNAESIIGRSLQGNMRTAAGKVTSKGRDVNEVDDIRKSNHLVGFRKMSGWDRLPGSCRNSESRLISISQKHKDFSSDPTPAHDSINRGVGSSSRRGLSSRTERVQSSDISRRNYRSNDRPSRSNDRSGYSPQAEKHREEPRLLERRGPPVHLQGRGRVDNWVDSYYGSRNAAAAAVAKVESNGFVVAPDGTIVKTGGAGSASHVTIQSVNASSRNSGHSPLGRGSPIERERMLTRAPGHSRVMSPDRSVFAARGKAGRYDHGMDGVNHRERYCGPMPDDIINSPSLLHHATYRRDRSVSPVHRRPLHLSHSRSRSPSRSRTRSPHRWASPRDRCQNVMNGSPGLRRRSRSPNSKSVARMDKPQAAFGERIASYALLPQNYITPPRTSRWIDGRKEMPEQFRDYDYKRGSERSPPGRVFSRGHRFDLMDLERRPGPNEYSTPSYSGRVKEFVGFGRGSRNDGRGGDIRDHGDRYTTLHSARQHVNGGSVKRYVDKNDFMVQNMRANSSEFQRRDSLRAFDRDTERQHGDSPRRSRDGKGHFRNGDEGNHDTNFKSFGVRDGDSNMAAVGDSDL